MTERHQVICDVCDADITFTGNSIDYRIALTVEPIPNRGGYVTDMMIYPPLDKNRHFCGEACLRLWCSNFAARAEC